MGRGIAGRGLATKRHEESRNRNSCVSRCVFAAVDRRLVCPLSARSGLAGSLRLRADGGRGSGFRDAELSPCLPVSLSPCLDSLPVAENWGLTRCPAIADCGLMRIRPGGCSRQQKRIVDEGFWVGEIGRDAGGGHRFAAFESASVCRTDARKVADGIAVPSASGTSISSQWSSSRMMLSDVFGHDIYRDKCRKPKVSEPVPRGRGEAGRVCFGLICGVKPPMSSRRWTLRRHRLLSGFPHTSEIATVNPRIARLITTGRQVVERLSVRGFLSAHFGHSYF